MTVDSCLNMLNGIMVQNCLFFENLSFLMIYDTLAPHCRVSAFIISWNNIEFL